MSQDQNPDAVAAKIISKAWSDSDFKAQLLDDPRGALAGMGTEVPSDVNMVVVEDTADTVHFVIPRAPSDSELSESELDSIAAGAGAGSAPWVA